MRGKEITTSIREVDFGITPAYAGKSRCLRVLAFRLGDHPRVCGEKLVFFVFCPYVLGSPPRMRGKAEQSEPWGMR